MALWATSCSAQESTVLSLCLEPDFYGMQSMYSLKGWTRYTIFNFAQGFFLKGSVDLTGCWRLNLPAKYYLSGLYSSPWGYLPGPHCHYLLLLLLGVGEASGCSWTTPDSVWKCRALCLGFTHSGTLGTTQCWGSMPGLPHVKHVLSQPFEQAL